MLNLAMLNQEKIIAIVIVLAMLWVAFKIASAILKPVMYVALAWALYMYVYHPASLRAQINTEVARLSPAANYAVAAFNECLNTGAPSNSTGACQATVSALALKQGGGEYAAKANAAVEMLIGKLKQSGLSN